MLAPAHRRFDPVEPPGAEPPWFGQFGDVRDLIGDLVEDQLDLHAGQVRADAEVSAVAAESQCCHPTAAIGERRGDEHAAVGEKNVWRVGHTRDAHAADEVTRRSV